MEGLSKLLGCSVIKVDTFSDFLRSYIESVVSFVCGEYHGDSDKCDQLVEGTSLQNRRQFSVAPLNNIDWHLLLFLSVF